MQKSRHQLPLVQAGKLGCSSSPGRVGSEQGDGGEVRAHLWLQKVQTLPGVHATEVTGPSRTVDSSPGPDTSEAPGGMQSWDEDWAHVP